MVRGGDTATPAPLELIAPESDLLEASVGDELALTVELNREDVDAPGAGFA